MRIRSTAKSLAVFLTLFAAGAHAAIELEGVRMHEAPDSTRVVFDTSGAVEFKVFTLKSPNRVVVDLMNVRPVRGFKPSAVALGRKRISRLRGSEREENYRLVIDTKEALKPTAFKLKPIKPYGHRLVVDLYVEETAPRAAPSERKPNRNVVIAIDAGHGGDDPGAIGPRGVREKQVVLQISKRVVKNLDAKRGFDGELVRTGDYYLGHRKRTDIARRKRADLFVSIHADAFKQSDVSGASVYTLSDRGASSETAAWLAERENRSDLLGGVGDVSIGDKDPVLAQLLLDLSMDGNRSQSIEAGQAVLEELGSFAKLHKRRVEQAAFVVLKSPDMPSILVETGFISNPGEARRLSQADYQAKIARAIADGIARYMRANPPPGTWLAEQGAGSDLRYTIARGDTISTIAARYGLSSKRLKAHNGLATDRIRVGQVLLIPAGG